MKQFYLGNDIVDLTKSDDLSAPNKVNFVRRVYSEEECRTIFNSSNANTVAWAIWAAKEAAYKSHKKIDTNAIFKINQYQVNLRYLPLLKYSLNNFYSFEGFVVINHFRFLVKWVVFYDKIHCYSILDQNFSRIKKISILLKNFNNFLVTNSLNKFFSTKEKQSISSNQTLVTRYYAKKLLWHLGFSKNIEVVRTINLDTDRLNPPQLIANGVLLNSEISLSHDGSWSAIAIIP